MIHKIVTSQESPYFAIPPKVYKKSEAVVRLMRQRIGSQTGLHIERGAELHLKLDKLQARRGGTLKETITFK